MIHQSSGQRIVLFLFLIFTVWLSFYTIQPPNPEPESSPLTEFSAERAFNHVREMAQQPHPLGSAANDSARSYILDELRNLGLRPAVREGIGIGSSSDRGVAGYAKNILAKLEGENPEKTILLMAHYDSTPVTFGAGDDASGTAAILETVRALQARETPLKNNVWILLTDGEERGLLGAELFVDEFAELDQIDLVLNVEARGSSGPSMMFETSTPNGKLISHFAAASQYPVANSLMYTVYKMLPNDTDLSVTKRAGLQGLNFAFTNDYLNYHTLQDNPENLSLSSLQHHGSNLLDNVLYFGNENYDLNNQSEYVYFNNATGGLMYYPSGWSLPLAVVTSLLFIAYLVYLFRTNRLGIGPYLGSLLLFAGITAAGGFITHFGWQGFKVLNPQYQWLIQGEVYNHVWYFWGFTLLNIALFSAVYSWFQTKLTMQQLISGSFTIWIFLSLITAWYLPTASYVFTWPVLLALVGWIILGGEITKLSWRSTGILAISLFGVLFMLPPYIYLIQIMMTTQLLFISMILLMLVLGLTWPLVWNIIRGRQKVINIAVILTALVCFGMASANSGFDADHKKQNSINFVQDFDSNQAYWISRDDTADAWTSQFLGENYQKGKLPNITVFKGVNLLYRQADPIQIQQPEFTVTADSISDSLRHLSIQIDAGQGIAMFMDWDKQSAITNIGIQGTSVFERPVGDYLYYFQDLSEPVDLNIRFRPEEDLPSLQFTFLDPGIPTHLIPDYKPRMNDAMPPPFSVFMSDAAIWQTSLNLGEVLSSDP